jgi:hypothetical protein
MGMEEGLYGSSGDPSNTTVRDAGRSELLKFSNDGRCGNVGRAS